MKTYRPLILQIKEREEADELAFLCSSSQLPNALVTARYPVLEYILYFLRTERRDTDYVFVSLDTIDQGLKIAHSIASTLDLQSVILIHSHQENRSDYPKNLHIFKTIREGLQYIKDDLK